MPATFLRQNRILAAENDDELTLAMADPFDETSLQSLKLLINKNIKVCIAEKHHLDRAFDRLYKKDLIREADTTLNLNNDLAPRKENGPADKIFDELINTAINNGASDPYRGFRNKSKNTLWIDGQSYRIGNSTPKYISDMLISRIKIIGNLNVAENDCRKTDEPQFQQMDEKLTCEFRLSQQ